MLTYIALLRGINVSGQHKIKMTDLKQLFFDLGYHDVATYIQSGNVIFKSNIKEPILIENTIISAISIHFGHAIEVLILTKDDLMTIFNANPFLAKDPTTDISKLHVTILNKMPDLDGIPTVEILREGGYEGHTSQMAFGLPAKWKESIEPLILGEVLKLSKEIGIAVPDSK